MKCALFCCLVLMTMGTAFAQGSLKGRILEQSTKQPIPAAVVSIKDTRWTTVTDTLGMYSIKGIPEGEYILQVSSVGFQPKETDRVVITSGKTFYLETELLNNISSLKEVTIKTFRNEQNPALPVSTYSFSREEIFRTPGAQGDIFRVIGILPGVTSSGGQFSAIAVRGQGVRDNVYMVDDIPMTAVSHLEGSGGGSVFNDPNGGRFSIFAPRVVDNATFQGGGFGAEYGRKSSSYLGLGIKEGNRETPSFSAQVDLLGATLIYDGPSYMDKNTSMFATARYQNFYLLEKVVGLKDVGLPMYGDYMLKTTTALNAHNKLSLLVMYNPEKYTLGIDDVKQQTTIQSTDLVTTTNNKFLAGLNLRTLTSKNSYWKNVVYYRSLNARADLGIAYPEADSQGNFADKSHIRYETGLQHSQNDQAEAGYRSVFVQHWERMSLTAGVDASWMSIDNAQTLTHTDTLYTFTEDDIRAPGQNYLELTPALFNASVHSSAWNASVYSNVSWTAFPWLVLNPGLRYDYTWFSAQQTLSPRLSGSFLLDAHRSINFATGIFYQDPLPEDIGGQPSGHRLQEERTIQYILGYKHYFSEDLKWVAEAWGKQFNDLIVQPFSGQSLLNNNGTGYAYGVDVSLTKRLSSKYYGQIGYSYMRSRRDDHDGRGMYNFDYDQPHIVSLLASYQPNNRWAFSTKFRYATGRPKDAYVIHSDVFGDPSYLRYSQEITGRATRRLDDFISWDIRGDYRVRWGKKTMVAFVDIVDLLDYYDQAGEEFQPITGKTYDDGLGIFPSFGLRLEY
ncbi:TonB-dependent receptor [Dinghuibacter silviterrae]|uniref:Outer membrane receptor protein involved in Fe transport n=1 Tax=Dinghuibacter silviterrae TaxID=1539049 RepID=A0A4V3GKQ4_9BACT|nr:carboxypeptidase-like regulatory domain-containing protein [Dinghuibacter silviterrae]TDW96602.1 outer membrane receptor protein involved in Fe transport [Dinghuibacter silviterrae]